MKFNLATPFEIKRAEEYLNELKRLRGVVEIKKVSPHRTLSQNKYLHLLLGYWGSRTGYSLEESKLIYKELNANIYAYDKKGRTFYRSSADLNTAEMTQTIDRFREWSASHDIELPAADDKEFLRWAENESERHQQYL